MKVRTFTRASLTLLMVTATLWITGCGQKAETTSDNGAPTTETASNAQEDDHSGWWCAEHGVPEAECSICSSKVAEACKAKGDWCEEHNRAESQCFICDPSRAEKFAKLYEAKLGHKPKTPTE